ncbi:hypothetical protein SELSPUOL_01665 [Selenomonas sputigena ATCC 35185]|uniref:Uncharacterized protein n=1 Tax=Selenomonas sputigena (strain ATCC 35185 / DSM 20758 / CCUG 44933 / VPI D19B-28) TaxID=546271 RepID=C9LW13_SELS3|nr:hypothetical protein SELSPUOL_01665 [Selenomonas sputigena ATCC 35185]
MRKALLQGVLFLFMVLGDVLRKSSAELAGRRQMGESHAE